MKRNMVAGIGLMLTAVVVAMLWRSASSQSMKLFDQENIYLQCFQNGAKIFDAGPLESLSQVGVERTVEFMHTDGQPGQVRVIGIDGQMGSKTRNAIAKYQASNNLEVTGEPSPALQQHLLEH